MEEFYVENSKLIVRCPECNEIVKFEINYENFCVSIECKNGHNKNNLSHGEFARNYIKSCQIYKSNCYNCFNLLYDELINYKCLICNKLFCSKCINNHVKEAKHNSKIKFFQQYQICTKHNQKYSFFCEECKIIICEKMSNIT